jgi:hypothetical protein
MQNDSVQFEQWFNDSDKGYINYTLDFSKVKSANRPGK